MTKKLEELLNLPESQEIVQEEKAKAEAEDKKAEDKQQSLQAQATLSKLPKIRMFLKQLD